MNADALQSGVRLIAWSRIWSPLVPKAWREEAWDALDLPDTWTRHEPAFWKTFQTGLPSARVSLLLHSALDRDGGATREDWMRVAAHLGLVWDGHQLAPDHLGAACEIVACAMHRGEGVLVRELCARYLLPWCAAARARLDDGSPLAPLPAGFEADLRDLTAPVAVDESVFLETPAAR